MRVLEGDCVELMAAMEPGSVDAVVCDPPYALSFMGRGWDRFDGASIDPAFGHWLAGFIDGEGCFHIHRKPQGTFDCQFSIALRGDDMPVLQRCHKQTGLGTLAMSRPTEGNPKARWTVSSKAACVALRDLLRAFPLRAKKAQDFELWSDAVDEWVAHERGEWDSMAEIRATLMDSRAYVDGGVRVDPFQMWCWRWGREALRVLKPGGHLLAMGGTRTYHRLTAGLEDAGFEIRDTLAYLFGSGFPKSLDVGKAIDRAAGAEREVVGQSASITPRGPRTGAGFAPGDSYRWGDEHFAFDDLPPHAQEYFAERAATRGQITAPATPEAERWEGWGTALKPAHEPVVVARKPLSGTVAQTVLEHGVGGLNIAGCRVGHASPGDLAESQAKNPGRDDLVSSDVYGDGRPQQSVNAAGRWPSNVVLDEEAGAMLDQQTGEVGNNGNNGDPPGGDKFTEVYGRGMPERGGPARPRDKGGPSRFMYCAKASRAERNAGLDGLEGRLVGSVISATGAEYEDFVHPVPEGLGAWLRRCRDERDLSAKAVCAAVGAYGAVNHGGAVSNWEAGRSRPTPAQWCKLREVLGFDDRYDEAMTATRPVVGPVFDGKHSTVARANVHPTVKPVALMRWLVRLVCPPGGLVLDPFCGSGTTGMSCVLEGMDFIGCEREAEYVEIARARIAHVQEHGDRYLTPPVEVEQAPGQLGFDWDAAA